MEKKITFIIVITILDFIFIPIIWLLAFTEGLEIAGYLSLLSIIISVAAWVYFSNLCHKEENKKLKERKGLRVFLQIFWTVTIFISLCFIMNLE
ncbi:MAG: hypothetical protein KA163_09400 [Bacteroidia bacterium]|nr:hypothetical protein [Bacteroidia bacterium]